jgi:predicted metal-dependent enzyme (double-stranded beta helix superfamily)
MTEPFDQMIRDLERAAISPGEYRDVTQAVKGVLAPWLKQALPATHTGAGATCYARHLIHCDPAGRWCAVAIVLARGQSTPIHNHTTWGVIGVVEGQEREVRYQRVPSGELVEIGTRFNAPGEMSVVIPPRDIHRIEGAAEGPTVSIHVYGGDVDKVTAAVFEQAGLPYVGPCTTTRS